jgi:hypothetical protein
MMLEIMAVGSSGHTKQFGNGRPWAALDFLG